MTVQEDIARAVEVLKAGGVVLYPTDTVWGIGCDAASDEAVRKVYAIKRRADSKALISLVGSRRMLELTVGDVPDSVSGLIESSSRPVTVVYPSGSRLAGCLLAEDGSAGIRLTSELYSSALCLGLGGPVVSTSANVSGRPSPRFFSEIEEEIINAVDYVASYRRDDVTPSLPSMVVKLLPSGELLTLRP